MRKANRIERIDNFNGYLTDEQVKALEEITGFTNEIYHGNIAYSFYFTESKYYDKIEYFNPDSSKNIHDDLKAAGLPPIDINYDKIYDLPNDQWSRQDILDVLHQNNLCTEIEKIDHNGVYFESELFDMCTTAGYFVQQKVDEILCKVNDYVYSCETRIYDEHSIETKYKLTDEKIPYNGKTLYRIQALRDFADVKTGDLGGYVENETNLSHSGNAWIYGNAMVFDRAKVYGNATVHDNALVFDGAEVYDNAQIHDNSRIFGKADICKNAKVFDEASVSDFAAVSGNAKIYGNASVVHGACIYGNTCVYGDTQITGAETEDFDEDVDVEIEVTDDFTQGM